MIGDRPSDEIITSLENHLGSKVILKPLHPWWVRFRHSYAQRSLLTASTHLLVTANGHAYKLYVTDDRVRLSHMVERAEQAAVTELFPKLIWRSEKAVLFEYLPGKSVCFRRRKFSAELGKVMAQLHQLNLSDCDSERLAYGIDRDLKFLSDRGVLSDNLATHRAVFHELLQDESLQASMDYADVKPGNYLWDTKGDLRLIDLGALRANRPAGQYLCGSLYFRLLDRNAFSEAYLSAGGLPQVVDKARLLRMLNCVWVAAKYLQKMDAVPVYLPLHRMSYRFLVGYLIWEFRRLSKKQNLSFQSI